MYDSSDFNQNSKSSLERSLNTLLIKAEHDSKLPESNTLAVGGALRKPLNVKALYVNYGFKAPISMIFVPFWKKVVPHLKFLHVVRDGRDISFSANQGPVTKFYDDMYSGTPHMNQRLEVKAIKLWSDWNSQLFQWSITQYKQPKITTEDSNYQYYVLHSEDILDENISLRYKTLYNLGLFVGSNISDEELCCLAHSGNEFLGSHDRSGKITDKSDQVKSRYGKWRKNTNLILLKELNERGAEGLSIFGYDPYNRSQVEIVNKYSLSLQLEQSRSSTNKFLKKSDYKCEQEIPNYCKEKILQYDSKNMLLSDSYSFDKKCSIVKGTDFKSEDIASSNVFNHPPNECCKQCINTSTCQYFTYNTKDCMCYLKTNQGNIIRNENTKYLISGMIKN
jgi:hypothetical protein